MTIFYPCTKCGEETCCDVRLRQSDSGLPDACAHCGAAFDMNDEAAVIDRAEEKAREPQPDDVI